MIGSLEWAIPLLRCPVCRGALTLCADAADDAQGHLAHDDGPCQESYPVIDGIPRLLVGPARGVLVRDRADWFSAVATRREIAERWSGRAAHDPVVRAFDAEWSRFDDVGSSELRSIFALYFDLVPAHSFASDLTVLDAGCGGGRWAAEVAARGPRVIAVDLGRSVEVARRNTAATDRVACVQADLRALPLADGATDWAYSLGVLHHIDAAADALRNIVRAVRPRGAVLLYLYYALDHRGPMYRAAFRIVDALRRVLSRSPRSLLVGASSLVALLVYWPLARASAALAKAGLGSVADAMPLSFYRHRSLEIMRNDSLDRFGTSVEHRYTRAAMEELMRSSGLSEVRLSDGPPHWHGYGVRER
ncbi:MAG: methyltransferase domain-containing protein [Elusimicrobia bacterium]|nr:methyltransferase domain-containing protein [Elusimicrobiota bacterium]